MTKSYPPLSHEALKGQGKCCGRECVNCPYEPKFQKGSTKIKK